MTWWPEVARTMTQISASTLSIDSRTDGQVFHYQPFDFLRWMNQITWNSEWPKYPDAQPRGSGPARHPRCAQSQAGRLVIS